MILATGQLAEKMRQHAETKYQLAKSIGVSQSTVANWLSGQTTPQLRHIDALAQHYACETTDFLKEE